MTNTSNTQVLPLISVITVCYNENPERIHHTFSSIVNQNYKGFEWVVVDGGSDNDTIAAIQEYRDYIHLLISEPDEGIYDAMNKGAAQTSGAYLNFLNVGDAYFSIDTLARVADEIKSTPGYDCYFGDVIYVSPRDSHSSLFVPQMRVVNKYRFYTRGICHQAVFSSRRLYDQIGGFDMQYSIVADREWMIRSLGAGAKWLHIEATICEYDNGGVSSDVNRRSAEVNKAIRSHYGLCERATYGFIWKIEKGIMRVQKAFEGENG